VFRAVLFSIVLTLAIGQNAGLLCKVSCYAHDAAPAGCPHQHLTTSASVRGVHDCDNHAVGAIGVVREDALRADSAPDAQNAIVVPRFLFSPPLTASRPGYETAQVLRQERPLLIALRI
jgi:hypothetical protein